jgi:hypothetical protein
MRELFGIQWRIDSNESEQCEPTAFLYLDNPVLLRDPIVLMDNSLFFVQFMAVEKDSARLVVETRGDKWRYVSYRWDPGNSWRGGVGYLTNGSGMRFSAKDIDVQGIFRVGELVELNVPKNTLRWDDGTGLICTIGVNNSKLFGGL